MRTKKGKLQNNKFCLIKVDALFKIVLNPEASFEQYEDWNYDFLDDENED
jgi:hypothetical protein